jgi:hypothetical protein
VGVTPGVLSKRALDILNRAGEIKSEIDFCRGGLAKEMRHFMGWLGEHLRAELQLEAWEDPEVRAEEGSVGLYLFPHTWRLGETYVAFSLGWPSPLNEIENNPGVMFHVPAQELFPPRNELLNRLRPKLKRTGFIDHAAFDTDPAFPLWNEIRPEEFHTDSGFDLDSFVKAIVEGFQRLMEVEPLIEDAFRSLLVKQLQLPSERGLKTIAFLDTETEGSGSASRMTQLAIVNVAYDPEEDAVVGILKEYFMDAGQSLDKTEARATLERAEFIVAHNISFDRPLLARNLLGTEKMKWCCSLRDLEWKQLLEVQSASLETLIGKVGLKYDQDHTARADARVLRSLLALKHNGGRTYLGRLLDKAQAVTLT